MIFFKIIKSYIIDKKITINYFCQQTYIRQVSEFNDIKNINIKDINKKPPNSIELWIENSALGGSFTEYLSKCRDKNIQRVDYNHFYKHFCNAVLQRIMKIPIVIKKYYYKDNDLKTRYINLNTRYNNIYNKIQILILNSKPLSDQFKYNKAEWDNYILHLNKNYNIVTTTKVEGVCCTMDNNLTVKDIAAISIKASIIIAINSGVVPGLLNKYTLNYVNQVYIFDDRCTFSYPKFTQKNHIKDITRSEINRHINL
jgi:hypothetical protein